jgi:aminopeptidase
VIDELGSRYAELAVRVGANVQPGQTLFVLGEPEHAALMRAVAAAGWAAGAGDVQPIYRDEYARRLHALHAAEDKLDRTPGWIEAAFLEMEGAALVVTLGDADPNLFDEVDQSRAAQAEPRRAREIVHDQVARQACAWRMIACPTPGWAQAIFGEPDVERLWHEIAAAARLDEAEPVAAWDAHVRALDERGAALVAHDLDALRFHGAGTDLTVRLIQGAVWKGAKATTSWGQEYVANLPTEEVFTTPDRRRTEGVVRTTKPLYWYGSVAEDVELQFEAGRIVGVAAARGEDFIRSKVETDDGAGYLGEVALVDSDSRIGGRDLVFRNGLLDENAACHIAIGGGYTEPVEGAEKLSDAERLEAGINVSRIHIDLMIGSRDVDVDGLRRDGTVVPVLRGGNWVLSA